MSNTGVNTKVDVLIVGAGIAGATLAANLAKMGKNIVVVERDLSERDVIIGELLQPGGVQKLEEMGFTSLIDNIDAQPVYGYDIIYEDRDYLIPYPNKNGEPCGFGFRNGAFLQNIRKHILTQRNIRVIEGTVTNLIEDEDAIVGVSYKRKLAADEESLYAHLTVVTDGPLSKFREKLSKPFNKLNGYFLGLLLKNCELPFANHGHLIMGEHPPMVIYPVTSTSWRVLIDFKGEKPPRLGRDFKKFLLEEFKQAMPKSARAAFVAAVEKGKIKTFPNHRLPANPIKKQGAVLLGDALNMRHPLTGGGMTAAFNDVLRLSNNLETISDFSNLKQLGKAIQKFYQTRHLGTQTTNILADGLYGVVYNPDLRKAFFEYVSRGDKYAEETCSILAGLNKDKKLLLNHFIAMARYGTQLKISAEKPGVVVTESLSMVKDAVGIITPLLLSEKPDPGNKLMLEALNRIV
ncbi:FAD-dependent oxidoreductase [uncultured Eudoraea sp.]|uniref:FAD-dependent oxidoreductase n=1 Tax=uncultured Eudoraea sp. TaxID=1035614 RepID=UPI002611A8EC|nr:FAD-dependent oxidoreductase [uncultured Eudoraea sp.]